MKSLLILLFLTTLSFATEREEVDKIAKKYNAIVEYKLWDNTRVDMLTATHAIEVDFASKWAEAIGQSLYYAQVTGLKPGIVLLSRGIKLDGFFIYRCQTIASKYSIDLWVETLEIDK